MQFLKKKIGQNHNLKKPLIILEYTATENMNIQIEYNNTKIIPKLSQDPEQM